MHLALIYIMQQHKGTRNTRSISLTLRSDSPSDAEMMSQNSSAPERNAMEADDLTTRVARNPKYQELKAKRTRMGWWLTLAMMVVYYGFILLVAFAKPFLATRLGGGVTTIGMPIGLGVIVFTIGITAIYVRRANS